MKNGVNLNLDLTHTTVADPGQELTLQGSYAHVATLDSDRELQENFTHERLSVIPLLGEQS